MLHDGAKIPAAAALAWNPTAFSISHGQCSTKARLTDKKLGLEGNKRLHLLTDQEDNAFFMVDNDEEEYIDKDNEMQENAPDTGDAELIISHEMR